MLSIANPFRLVTVLHFVAIAMSIHDTPTAHAENKAHFQLLQRARSYYRNLEYRQAIRAVEQLLDDDPKPSEEVRIEALEILGKSYVILGDTERARRAIAALYQLQPLYEFRDLSGSPKLKQFFLDVRRNLRLDEPRQHKTLKLTAPNTFAERNGISTANEQPSKANRVSPFYQRWWFWTAIGAALVAGSATAIIVGVSSASPKGTLGTVYLPE